MQNTSTHKAEATAENASMKLLLSVEGAQEQNLAAWPVSEQMLKGLNVSGGVADILLVALRAGTAVTVKAGALQVSLTAHHEQNNISDDFGNAAGACTIR